MISINVPTVITNVSFLHKHMPWYETIYFIAFSLILCNIILYNLTIFLSFCLQEDSFLLFSSIIQHSGETAWDRHTDDPPFYRLITKLRYHTTIYINPLSPHWVLPASSAVNISGKACTAWRWWHSTDCQN